MRCRAARIIFIFIILSSVIRADILKDQSISWTNFSFITSIALGYDFVYFGTSEGILRYSRFEHRWYPPITVSDGVSDPYIHRLAVTPDGQVITVQTNNGVFTYDIVAKNWFVESNFPEDLFIDSRPRTPLPYFLMPPGYQMSPNGYISDDNFREYQITAYLDDNFSTVYTGTWGMGPMLVDNDDFSAHLIPYGLLQKRTDVIYIEGDSIWMGGNEGTRYTDEFQTRFGVTLYDKSKERFTWLEPRYIYGFDSEIIFDIAGDKKNLYFAGLNGLTIYKRNTGQYITLTRQNGLPETEVTALAIAPDSVWIGTYQGLALYTPSADTMVIVSKSIMGQLFITDLELADSKLFIGSTDGAYYIDFRTLDVGRLQDPEGNLGGEIRHISTHKNEVIISSSSGVTVINLKTEKSEQLPFIDFALGAYAAVANDKYFAIAVQDGLLLLTRDKAPKHNHFDIDDGLLSNNITTIVPDGDFLWLGSDEGLTRFKWMNPDRVD
ncbi:MAG: hypothetical protein ABIE07_11335 [Candidatus Zixiibacteriota bacterium]